MKEMSVSDPQIDVPAGSTQRERPEQANDPAGATRPPATPALMEETDDRRTDGLGRPLLQAPGWWFDQTASPRRES